MFQGRSNVSKVSASANAGCAASASWTRWDCGTVGT